MEETTNKKNPKVVLIIAVIVLALIICVLIGMIIGNNTKSSSSTYAPRIQQEESSKMSVNDYMVRLQDRMNENDLSDATLDYDSDSKCINVYFNVDGAESVSEAAMAGYSQAESAWNDFGDTCVEASDRIGNDFRENCGSDKHVAFILLNDVNSENMLFCAIDGQVVYDVVTGEDSL